MSRRLTKQIFIAFIFFIILAVGFFLIYFAVQLEPSCSDGIKNQNETDIDCGGVCSSCELARPEKIEVVWSKAVLSQNNFYDVAVKINNPNQNLGSNQIPYALRLYDRNNVLAGERSGTTFILPNQTKYIIELKIESAEVVNNIQISFGEIKWQLSEESLPRLTILQKEYSRLDNTPEGDQVKGIIVNESEVSFSKVYVSILLFDSDHKLVGLNIAEIENLLTGQKRSFVAVWFKNIDKHVAIIETEASTNIFDETNIEGKYNEIEKFQER